MNVVMGDPDEGEAFRMRPMGILTRHCWASELRPGDATLVRL
ncbi:MAG: hypothetical protein QOH80_176 [Actinomycetota bacterium]|nr:hypothetical protein [Actinomycetota bacterium]